MAAPLNPDEAVARAKAKATVQMYDVNNTDGSLVASFSSLPMARAEARRLGGNVVPRGNNVAAPVG